MHSPLLAPLMALVLWSFVMCAWLYATRIPAIARGKIVYDPQRPNAEFMAQIPARVRWKADNYNNLMEQPTLFYAVTLTLALLGAGDGLNVALAWTLCRPADRSQPGAGDHQRRHDSFCTFHGRVVRLAGDVRAGGDDCVLARGRVANSDLPLAASGYRVHMSFELVEYSCDGYRCVPSPLVGEG